MNRFFKNAIVPIMLVMLLALLATSLIGGATQKDPPPYSVFKTQLAAGELKKVELQTKGNVVKVTPKKKEGDDEGSKPYQTGYAPQAAPQLEQQLTQAVADGKIELDPGVDREAVREQLLSMRGIGPWTADYIAMRALANPDILLTGWGDTWLFPLLLEAAGGLTENVLNLTPASFAPMPVRYNPPSDLGSDRLANALAMFHLYGGPACSVDLGTATNFDVVSASGEFVGGAIAPGLGTAADALWSKAARLKDPGWGLPARALGQSTAECLSSGTLLGYAGLVDEMVRLLAAEAGPFVRVVAVGGMAHIVSQAARAIDEVRPTLTLEGLNIAFRLSRPGGA